MKTFNVVRIELGIIEAETIEEAQIELEENYCKIGHSSEGVYEPDDKIAGNFTIAEFEEYKRLKNIEKEFNQYKNESIKWSVEDFTGQEIKGWSITPEQAQEALESMIHHHDASIGINWDTIDVYYKEFGTKNDDNE
jgi:hypothetical protein